MNNIVNFKTIRYKLTGLDYNNTLIVNTFNYKPSKHVSKLRLSNEFKKNWQEQQIQKEIERPKCRGH